MQLGLYMDILDGKSFIEALDYSAGLELDTVEIGTGNFSSSPHCRLDELVQSQTAREEFLGAIADRGACALGPELFRQPARPAS